MKRRLALAVAGLTTIALVATPAVATAAPTGVFVASYTDAGGDGLPSLTGTDEVVLVPSA
ncbi:hypothetical protein [Micromonospora luteifusca]|uniref:hypothetical protein n=1 Tax=Micromonospora luteifusca TaxID=709860 RepID=UPI0033A6AEF7